MSPCSLQRLESAHCQLSDTLSVLPIWQPIKLNHLTISLDQEGRPGHLGCWLLTLKISINVHLKLRAVLGQLQWVEHTGHVHSCVTHAKSTKQEVQLSSTTNQAAFQPGTIILKITNLKVGAPKLSNRKTNNILGCLYALPNLAFFPKTRKTKL